MPATKKVSTQLLVSPHVRDRARALAIVRMESVAEVNRAALEGFGLVGLERRHADDLAGLWTMIDEAAHRTHIDRSYILEAVRKSGLGADAGQVREFLEREFA